MKAFPFKTSCFILIFFIISCSGTKLTPKQVNENFIGKPVSNILVIGIGHNPEKRIFFENKFVAQLKAAGVEAVSSAKVIPMPPDLKLEKKDIIDAVKKFQNDAVIVTHVKSIDDKFTYTQGSPTLTSFYSYYGGAYGYVSSPGYTSADKVVRLETRLFDVKTEQLMWNVESKTWNIDSEKDIINDVIKTVIEDLQKNKMISKKPSD